MYPFRPVRHLSLVPPVPAGGQAQTPVRVRTYRAGDWSVVELAGELDLLSAASIPPLVPGLGRRIVFDLTEVTFMDCRGLGLLAGAASAAAERGGCVRVAGASRQVRRLVTLGLPDRSLSMFESLEAALTTPTLV
jgi:anti-sigma B factor antagonist